MKILKLLFLFLFTYQLAKADSPVKHDSTKFVIKQINFDASYKTDSSFIDTSINKLNILNPAFRNEHSFEHLIRIGYPIISNSLVARVNLDDYFFPSNYFAPFIFDDTKNTFYETKKQFTSLTYKHSGGTDDKEEVLEVLHTQNLNKAWNIGLNYNLYSSVSALNYQNSTDYVLNIFTRFTGKAFRNFNQIYYNSFTLEESGGLTHDSLINYKTGSYEGVTVNFNSASIAKTKYRQLGFNSINELKLNPIFINEDDTTEFANKDFGSIFYYLSLETRKRIYTDNFTSNKIDTVFYRNFYNRKLFSNDSIKQDRIRNSLMLSSPNLSKYLPNLNLSLTNELFYLNNSIPEDTIILNNGNTLYHQKAKAISNYQNTYFTTNVSQKFQKVLWDFDWRMYVLGYQSGDRSINVTAKMFADSAQTIGLTLKATEEAITPSVFYNNYFSNHFIWSNSFTQVKKQVLSAVASMKNPTISASVDYIALDNYVYFNSNAKPEQNNNKNNIYIMSYSLKSRFEFWKFGTENVVIWQLAKTDSIHVPPLIFYNSTDFQNVFHFFTGGKLYTKIGFDVYYQNSYKPDKYMPSTGVYYLQNNFSTGDKNVQVDFHITMKIKSVSFYFKYSHANSGYFNDKRQFTATHYPMLPATFSYGINWLFYD